MLHGILSLLRCHWKNFLNRSILGEDMDKSLVACFCVTVYIQCIKIQMGMLLSFRLEYQKCFLPSYFLFSQSSMKFHIIGCCFHFSVVLPIKLSISSSYAFCLSISFSTNTELPDVPRDSLATDPLKSCQKRALPLTRVTWPPKIQLAVICTLWTPSIYSVSQKKWAPTHFAITAAKLIRFK